MDDALESIEQQVGKKRNFDSPPLHLWHPPLSGDIPIRITADGTWYHDGGKIEREALVRLFASILRREEDGEYYLLTPAEKWRIEVELHPLLVTELDEIEEGGEKLLEATLNTGKKVVIDGEHPLFLEAAVGDIAAMKLDHGLGALFTRAAWYRLVESAEEVEGVPTIRSGGYAFPCKKPEQNLEKIWEKPGRNLGETWEKLVGGPSGGDSFQDLIAAGGASHRAPPTGQ